MDISGRSERYSLDFCLYVPMTGLRSLYGTRYALGLEPPDRRFVDRPYRPHHMIELDGSELINAGELVIEWLNKPGRTAHELLAVRSFFGWDIKDLSENQKLFIADAERQGITVIYDYVPEYSFGRTCLAIAPNQGGVWTNAISDVDYGNNFTIVRD